MLPAPKAAAGEGNIKSTKHDTKISEPKLKEPAAILRCFVLLVWLQNQGRMTLWESGGVVGFEKVNPSKSNAEPGWRTTTTR